MTLTKICAVKGCSEVSAYQFVGSMEVSNNLIAKQKKVKFYFCEEHYTIHSRDMLLTSNSTLVFDSEKIMLDEDNETDQKCICYHLYSEHEWDISNEGYRQCKVEGCKCSAYEEKP